VNDIRTITSLAQRVKTGDITSVKLVEECLAKITHDQSVLNAFITVTAERAREEAHQADLEIASGHYRGPLHGMPISLKDLIDVRGLPTTAASLVRQGHIAKTDADIVSTLRQAGVILVGKCNLHEFAFGTTSEDSAFGPTRNPHDTSRSPGGSSGGSAAAVAAGMCLASIGTDTGGSIRIPAAACGIVGLKPTFGELSCRGVVPLGRTLDHVGPLARCVNDVWLLYAAMVNRTSQIPPATFHQTKPIRLGLLRKYFMDRLEHDVRTSFEKAVKKLQQAGTVIEEVSLPHASDISPVYLHTVLPEAAAYHARTLETRPEAYTPAIRERLEIGRYILGEDYIRAMKGRETLRAEVDTALRGRHGLILPTLPIPAPPLGVETIQIEGVTDTVRNLTLRLSQLFNLTGHPAISLPIAPTPSGLPCGLQLVGGYNRTNDLLALSLSCEKIFSNAATPT